MKHTKTFKLTLSKHNVLALAVFIVFSVACDGANSSNNSAQQTGHAQETPAPANTPAGTANVAATPSTNSPIANSTKPTIAITEVPTEGAGEELQTIAGTVGGVQIAECKVVLFAYAETWYVQPFIATPNTRINEDNTWRNDTHLGTQYAALLVKKSYTPPKTTGKLPEIRGDILAIVIEKARQ
jgi:hypothetical protein